VRVRLRVWRVWKRDCALGGQGWHDVCWHVQPSVTNTQAYTNPIIRRNEHVRVAALTSPHPFLRLSSTSNPIPYIPEASSTTLNITGDTPYAEAGSTTSNVAITDTMEAKYPVQATWARSLHHALVPAPWGHARPLLSDIRSEAVQRVQVVSTLEWGVS
jgi:hypothetical protein